MLLDCCPCATFAGVHILNCACPSSPPTLYVKQTGPNDATPRTLQPCTLVYGPTPACLVPLAIGANTYLSTTTFVDGNGETFYYYYNCFVGYYALTRVYCVSIFGSPYQDIVRYRWTISSPPNQCSAPYKMWTGSLYAGGDPLCVMHVDETP